MLKYGIIGDDFMYINDGNRIIKANIVCKNDDRLEQFIWKNKYGKDSMNYEFNMPYDFSYNSLNENFRKNIRLKKLESLCIASSALNTCIGSYSYPSDYDVHLETLFRFKDYECYEDNINQRYYYELKRDIDKDLSIIESIIDNPYFYEIVEKMYGDYSGFLEIFSFIDFKCEEVYTINEVKENYQKIKYEYEHTIPSQRIINGYISMSKLKSAIDKEYSKNNHKILTRTKQIMLKLNK